MLQFKVKVTESEYIRFSSLFILSKIKIIKIIIPVFFISFLLALSRDIKNDNFPGMSTLALVVPVAVFFPIYNSFKKDLKKSYLKFSSLQEETVYTVDDSGINVKGETFESFILWDKVDNILTKKEFVMISLTPSFGNLIPRRNLTSEQLLQLLKYAHNANVKIKGIKKISNG